jgi:hypothetical protein
MTSINTNTANTASSQVAQDEAKIQAEIDTLEALCSQYPALGAALNQIIKTLESIKQELAEMNPDFTPEKPTDPTDGGAPAPSVAVNMGEMVAMLSQLEGLLAQLSNKRAENDNEIDTSLLQLLQQNVQAAKNQYDQLEQEMNSSNSWNTFLKVMEAVVAAVVAVVSLACGQPELAIMVVALAAVSLSGGFQEATKLVTEFLKKCNLTEAFQRLGLSKDEADKAVAVIASATVIIATVAITLITCGASAPQAALDTADELTTTGMEMTEMGNGAATGSGGAATTTAETTAETTTETANSASRNITRSISRALNWLKENNPMNKLPKGVNMAILSGSQATMQTNFVNNLVDAAAPNMSAQEKEKLKEILGILVDVIFSLVAVFAGMGASSTESSVSAESTLGKLTTRFQNWAAQSTGLMTKLQLALGGAMALQATGQGMLTASQYRTANIEQALGEYKSSQDILQAVLKMVNSDAQANTKNLTDLLSAHTQQTAETIIEFQKSQSAIAQQMA